MTSLDDRFENEVGALNWVGKSRLLCVLYVVFHVSM